MNEPTRGFHLKAAIAALEAMGEAVVHPDALLAARRLSQRTGETADRSATAPELLQTLRSRPAASSAINILMVEDDRLTSRILSDSLSADGYNVLVAASAAQARALMRDHAIELILLDLVLPDGDGRDLLVGLRSQLATRWIPALVITARNDAATQCECFALGADLLLSKPVSLPVLRAAVAMQLEHVAERRLEGRADALTGLPNREAFADALARAVALSRRNQQPLSLAMFDLDHFKSVNDLYGHAVGDEVLRACAQCIAAALRASDFLARYGGEELVAFFPDTSARGAARALEKALEAVRQLEFAAEPAPFGITFSAGVAAIDEKTDAEAALKEADRRLYMAKAAGRNCVIAPDDEADPPRPRALVVEDDESVAVVVRRLLEREGFGVAHFADGLEGLAAAEQEHFTVALIDLNVPRMNGFELVERLRARRSTSKLPVLFLTGSREEADVVRGFAIGANDYVVKPFNANELVARIHRLIPKR